jgi:phosphate transport system permease protein
VTATSPASDTRRRAGDVWSDRSFRAVALVAGLLVLAILALIAYVTTAQAWPAFKQAGFSFITSDKWIPSQNKFGALAFIYGTVVSSVIALIFAVPLSLGIALFMTELVSGRIRRWVTYVVDLLAAIPSVVYGYWALTVFAPPAQRFYKHIADTIGTLPGLSHIFGGPANGTSFMTAGLILAVMIIPIVTALSREALATVAQDDKNAALAMGATRWEMLRVTVFPRVRTGLVGAVMLGLGRALGETIAVALTIGANHQITSKVFQPGDSMAAVIAHEFGEATGTHRSALIGLGVVLFALTIAINMLARFVTNRTAGAYQAVVRA